jgi:hypothetical protein
VGDGDERGALLVDDVDERPAARLERRVDGRRENAQHLRRVLQRVQRSRRICTCLAASE